MALLGVLPTIEARNLIRTPTVHGSDFDEYDKICCKLGELKPIQVIEVCSSYITFPIPTNITIERYDLRLTNNSREKNRSFDYSNFSNLGFAV